MRMEGQAVVLTLDEGGMRGCSMLATKKKYWRP